MKKLTFVLIFISVSCLNYAQTPTWQWAKSGGGLLSEYGYQTAVDDSGNVYVAGRFTSPTMLIDSTTLINIAYENLFVAKFSSAGNLIWARSTSSEMTMFGNSIAVDHSGGVYIGGGFAGDSVVFGNSIIYNSDPTNSDIFLLKYDTNGNELWAVAGGGNDYDLLNNIAVDENGFIFMAGSFFSATFTMGNVSFTNCGFSSTDLFLIKFDNNGSLVWARSPCGNFDENASAITTDATGNIYIAGTFNSPVLVIGTDTLHNLTGNSYSDFFVAKYDSAGNALWALSEPNTFNQDVFGIAVDMQQNVYVAGTFDHPNFFIGGTNLPHSGAGDIFLASYDSTGTALWAIAGGGADLDFPNGIEVDASGNIIMVGSFYSPVLNIGPDSILTSGNQDFFIARFDPSGNVEWIIDAGDTLSDTVRGLSLDSNGDIIITGYFYSPTIAFGNNIVTNVLASDFYIAKLSTSVGITDDFASNSEIKLFPNPFSESITLESGTMLNNAIIEIFDMQGRSVFRFTDIEGYDFRIDFPNKQSGIYHLRLSEATGCQLANKKISLIESHH